MFDWGIGTSASATAYVKKHFGDLFLDFKEQLAWGIDGMIVKSATFSETSVNLLLTILPQKDYILLKARDVPQNQIAVIINNKSLGLKKKHDLEDGLKLILDGP